MRHLCPLSPFYENITSSMKLEVRNLLHCHQGRTEPRPQVTCTETCMKFGHVVFTVQCCASVVCAAAVCLSLCCLSVTSQCFVKTAKCRIRHTTLFNSPETWALVFSCQRFGKNRIQLGQLQRRH